MISSLLLVLSLLVLLGCTLSVAMDPVHMIMTDETNAESELTCNVFVCIIIMQSCLRLKPHYFIISSMQCLVYT